MAGSSGPAAVTLMLSFAGWEAVAPLTTRFADPAGAAARIAIALAVTTAIYLSLAVRHRRAGAAAATDVPLAELLTRVVGSGCRAIAGVAAVVLTLGTTNAYINGAIQMLGELRTAVPGTAAAFLAAIAITGGAGLALYGLGLVNVAEMVELPTALFLAVYLGAMIAAAKLLRGKVRLPRFPAGLAVAAMLSFCAATELGQLRAVTSVQDGSGLREAAATGT